MVEIWTTLLHRTDLIQFDDFQSWIACLRSWPSNLVGLKKELWPYHTENLILFLLSYSDMDFNISIIFLLHNSVVLEPQLTDWRPDVLLQDSQVESRLILFISNHPHTITLPSPCLNVLTVYCCLWFITDVIKSLSLSVHICPKELRVVKMCLGKLEISFHVFLV